MSSTVDVLPNLFTAANGKPKCTQGSQFRSWLASRSIQDQDMYLSPGAQRSLSWGNAALALEITAESGIELMKLLWALEPYRITAMLCLEVIRGIFPAMRCYSQALLIDELQSLIMSGNFTWLRVLRLLSIELIRRISESLLDTLISNNDIVVQDSIRTFLEYKQMENRVRLDLPTLSDNYIRDLLQESDLFVRSFTGSGGFGLLSPRDFVNIAALLSELIAQIYILISLTSAPAHLWALALAFLSAVLPTIVKWCGLPKLGPQLDEDLQWRETDASLHQERIRNMALNETHRPEMILFGLGPAMLKQWYGLRVAASRQNKRFQRDGSALQTILSQLNVSEMTMALQSVPLFMIMQTSSTSLGSLALYRSSVLSMIYLISGLHSTSRCLFQSTFLLGAFCAAMKIKPQLTPVESDKKPCRLLPEGGMKIDVRNLSYTYPGAKQPALKDVSFSIDAGETLAIVGFNGSGKSTLAKMLLRMLDFDQGALLINNEDIRRLDPPEYHRKLAVVLQDFSKYHNSTLQENIGVGCIEQMDSLLAIRRAVSLAGAEKIVQSLPIGLNTPMDGAGCDSSQYPSFSKDPMAVHGLSGGEWQRIALSRAFMRAENTEVDLLLFDEPTSHLDPHAQSNFFDTMESLSRSPTGAKKTIIFITHRLSTARRADKVAMMEHGTITEFGTHEELLGVNGSYAALYRASV